MLSALDSKGCHFRAFDALRLMLRGNLDIHCRLFCLAQQSSALNVCHVCAASVGVAIITFHYQLLITNY